MPKVSIAPKHNIRVSNTGKFIDRQIDSNTYEMIRFSFLSLIFGRVCSDETFFCVSSALICDGIHHCPSGDEYYSDEDATMCARHNVIAATNVSTKYYSDNSAKGHSFE